jgi:hypothetical protein
MGLLAAFRSGTVYNDAKLETLHNRFKIRILCSDHLDLEIRLAFGRMTRCCVGTLPERFERRNRPTLRLKPLSNLHLWDATKIDSTQFMTT